MEVGAHLRRSRETHALSAISNTPTPPTREHTSHVPFGEGPRILPPESKLPSES